ncbi:MAG: CHAT domain-containing protein, partial [Cyanobacteria bacterium P01_F01_bin.116]
SHNLTASDIGDLTQRPSRPLNILAGAFADPNQTFKAMVDRTATHFNGLTYAGDEVSFLKEQLPNTQVLLDQDFSRSRLDAQLNGQNIVHLATHAAFVPGQPEDSFILLGNGDTITLKELQHWSLPNVELVVLSACQTGISHIEDGLEILGMGFQVQRADAQAAMASLWWVDDRSTAQLMKRFYTELNTGATKVQALQRAQRYLMANGYDEPFHWAPFVLIGNGL